MIKNRLSVNLLWVVAIFAIVIRLMFLFRPMGYDEAFSFLMFASQPLKVSLRSCIVPNNHFFHTLLVHMITKILPPYPWAIRLPALIAGIAIVPFGYLAFKTIYCKEVGFLVVSLIAGSSILIEYSVNARGYTLMILFFLLGLWLLWQALKKNRLILWMGFILISALGFYTIPVMLYPFTFSLLSSLFVYRGEMDKRKLIKFCIAVSTTAIVVGLLYLPVVCKTGIDYLSKNPTFKPHPLSGVIQSMEELVFKIYSNWHRDLFYPIKIIFLVLFSLSLFTAEFKKINRIFLFSGIATALGLILITRRIPFPRCFLYLLPVYFGMIASGLYSVIQKHRNSAVIFMCISVIIFMGLGLFIKGEIYNSDVGGRLQAPEKIVYIISGLLKPGDKVLAYCPVDAILGYYFFLHRLPYTFLDLDLKTAERLFVVLRTGQDLNYVWEKFPESKTFGKFWQILKMDDIRIYLSFRR